MSNAQRVRKIRRIRAAVKTYAHEVYGDAARHETAETKITDMITDLLHLASLEGVEDISWLLAKSHDHFKAETAGIHRAVKPPVRTPSAAQ